MSAWTYSTPSIPACINRFSQNCRHFNDIHISDTYFESNADGNSYIVEACQVTVEPDRIHDIGTYDLDRLFNAVNLSVGSYDRNKGRLYLKKL